MNQTKDSEAYGDGDAFAKVKNFAAQRGLNFSRLQSAIPKIKANTPSLKADDCWNDSQAQGWCAIMQCMGWMTPQVPADMRYEILETENLDTLRDRITFLSNITDLRTVIHTVDELKDLAKQFIVHLQDNKDHLIKTGYPLKRFLPSLWMDWRMTDLYRTKIPGGVTLRKGADQWTECSYHWTSVRLRHPLPHSLNLGAPLAFNMSMNYCFPPEVVAVEALPQIDPVPYDEAPQMDGLTVNEAFQVERDRGDIFNLKLALLDQLHATIVQDDPDKLYDNCIRAVRNCLSAAQVRFCWIMDNPKYLVKYQRSSSMPKVPVGPICGGLNSLLSVMKRSELEIRAGLNRSIRASLGEALVITAGGRRYFKTASDWFSKEEKGIIDRSMHLYAKLLKADEALHDEIHSKWGRRLADELLVDVTANARVPRSAVEATKVALQGVVSLVEGKAALDVPALDNTCKPTQDHCPDIHQNVFRREGNAWIITFNNKTVPFRHNVGFEFIQILLRNPGRTFSCSELRSLAGTKRHEDVPYEEDVDDDEIRSSHEKANTLKLDSNEAAAIQSRLKLKPRRL